MTPEEIETVADASSPIYKGSVEGYRATVRDTVRDVLAGLEAAGYTVVKLPEPDRTYGPTDGYPGRQAGWGPTAITNSVWVSELTNKPSGLIHVDIGPAVAAVHVPKVAGRLLAAHRWLTRGGASA